MTDIQELKDLFRAKLERTGSLDAAFTKAVWVAYKAGYADGQTNSEHVLKWVDGEAPEALESRELYEGA
jgi:hypothetical protein